MTGEDLRERIKEVAVENINTNGFHGTTIRNIARDVSCSLMNLAITIDKFIGLASRFTYHSTVMRN
mgnify:CR=1 FL=1